ncbi:hypothetical protein G6L67_09225 [Agrobacterium tumefaciens]|uniref:Uncharacterized protein n=1 Tax=Agrobacterium tumefaciens str. Kerr 14 TaxID=1183424 RepID=A0A1S7NLU6_AGRTU|nr:DUF6714 family protein [Agrobacterium tumefaciens]NTE92027.1 hypothetical protein [Agrobacterium tumefaciens]CUX08827.1 conserved hypothetical protein [Agrobacterium tumefaciens str. Kerr 14]
MTGERIIEQADYLMRPEPDIIANAKAAVREAFAGVTLGGGVGLSEVQALDDYANNEVRAACRAGDEKNDWAAIPVEDLNRHSGSPAFLDAEGMRFHLPAYMTADLDGDYRHEFAPYSCGCQEKFSLLTLLQRNAVEAYLRAISETENLPPYQDDIERALEEWVDMRAPR